MHRRDRSVSLVIRPLSCLSIYFYRKCVRLIWQVFSPDLRHSSLLLNQTNIISSLPNLDNFCRNLLFPNYSLCNLTSFRSVCQEFCPRGDGVYLSARWDTHPTQGRHPPGQTTPPRGRQPPPADGYCCERYASYRNAFLFIIFHRLAKDQ